MIHLTEAQRRGLAAHLEQTRVEDARDAEEELGSGHPDDMEPEPLRACEIEELRVETLAWEVARALMLGAWGMR